MAQFARDIISFVPQMRMIIRICDAWPIARAEYRELYCVCARACKTYRYTYVGPHYLQLRALFPLGALDLLIKDAPPRTEQLAYISTRKALDATPRIREIIFRQSQSARDWIKAATARRETKKFIQNYPNTTDTGGPKLSASEYLQSNSAPILLHYTYKGTSEAFTRDALEYISSMFYSYLSASYHINIAKPHRYFLTYLRLWAKKHMPIADYVHDYDRHAEKCFKCGLLAGGELLDTYIGTFHSQKAQKKMDQCARELIKSAVTYDNIAALKNVIKNAARYHCAISTYDYIDVLKARHFEICDYKKTECTAFISEILLHKDPQHIARALELICGNEKGLSVDKFIQKCVSVCM